MEIRGRVLFRNFMGKVSLLVLHTDSGERTVYASRRGMGAVEYSKIKEFRYGQEVCLETESTPRELPRVKRQAYEVIRVCDAS